MSKPAKRVQCSLSRYVGGMSEFGRLKEAKVPFALVGANSGFPFFCSRNPISPKYFRGGFLVWFTSVLHVFRFSSFTKIPYGIVASTLVYVVDLIGGPSSIHIQPRKAMRRVKMAVNSDYDIAVTVATGNRARLADTGPLMTPRKHPTLRVVMQQLTESLCGKIGLSHDVLLKLIGQRPVRVQTACGLRYFNA